MLYAEVTSSVYYQQPFYLKYGFSLFFGDSIATGTIHGHQKAKGNICVLWVGFC